MVRMIETYMNIWFWVDFRPFFVPFNRGSRFALSLANNQKLISQTKRLREVRAFRYVSCLNLESFFSFIKYLSNHKSKANLSFINQRIYNLSLEHLHYELLLKSPNSYLWIR